MEKLTKHYNEFKTVHEKALVTSDQLVTGNVSAIEFRKAIENDVMLSMINFEDAETTKFTKPVLKTFVSVENGTENTPPSLSIDPVFISQTPTFDKLETQVGLTNEIIADSGINIMGSLLEQIGMQQAVKMQFEALNHSVFGIGSGLIDRANSFAEALKPDTTRADNIYKVVKSGIAGVIGLDSESVVSFILGLIADVPSRYQNDVVIYMGRDTWFNKVVPWFYDPTDTATNVLTQDNEALTFKGYRVVILDNMPSDVIFVGSLMNAYMGVPLNNSEMVESDIYTKKGTEILYHYLRYSFIPLDNNAIRVGVLAV